MLERITGDMTRYLQENLFLPLHMHATGYRPEHLEMCVATEACPWRQTVVRGSVHDEKAYLLGGVVGHAGLFSTVSDLMNFSRMILDEGVFEGNRIFSKESIERLRTPYVLR